MTKCILMNFDDRTRIVYDASNIAVTIGIGAIAEPSLAPATMEFLRNAMERTSDPLVIMPSDIETPAEVLSLLAILKDLNTADYDELLVRCVDLLGADNVGGPRPSRDELREKLRLIAARLAYGKIAATLAAIQSEAGAIEKTKVDAEKQAQADYGKANSLDETIDAQGKADAARARANIAAKRGAAALLVEPTEQEITDDVLGIVVEPPTGAKGGTTKELASALAGNKTDDPDAFVPKPKRSRQKAVAKKPASKGAKKAAPKRTAVSAKPKPAAKKAGPKRVKA